MLQTIEQSHSDKVKMYMKVPKAQLIEMLINCNTFLQGAPQIYRESRKPVRKAKQQLKVSIAQVEANQAHFYKYKYIGRATWPWIVRAFKDLAQQATV